MVTTASALLSPYQPQWPLQAAAALDALRALFGQEPGLTLEHIGSTAVPGLCAKPVLDLLLALPQLRLIETRLVPLAAAGWRYRPEYEVALPDRRYFVREATAVRPRLHLHGVETAGLLARRHLAFRDALRERPAWAARYAALKQHLAEQHADDKAAYQEAKGPFIADCLAELGLGDRSRA